jgi:hypothetical protein
VKGNKYGGILLTLLQLTQWPGHDAATLCSSFPFVAPEREALSGAVKTLGVEPVTVPARASLGRDDSFA